MVNKSDIKFIDSENCIINDEKGIFLREHFSLLKQAKKALDQVGAKGFFTNPNHEIKMAREALAEYFFTSALKKYTNQDLWVLQPQEDPPDFVLMTVNDNPITITLDQFELVEIEEHCKTFNEMMDIINSKLNKGYPKNYHLLIFVNHHKSKEWVELLNQNLEMNPPFQAIWTLYLLFQNRQEVFNAVVNRIRPSLVNITVDFNDKIIYKQKTAPNFTETIETSEGKFLKIKPEFADKLRKELLNAKLNKDK